MSEERLFQDRVRERDLDNFLVEELYSSLTFRSWFIARLGDSFVSPQAALVRLGKSPKRLQDNRQTDVRIGWFDQEQRLLACILIESKVTADFQEGQAESYAAELAHCRDLLGAQAACAVLVAPAAKLSTMVGNEAFDDCLSIEEIVQFLRIRTENEIMATELVSRLETRIDMLEALCGKRIGATWSPITLPEKRAFSELYAQMAAEIIPTLTVRASSDGPKAITKFFDGAKLPANFPATRIKHEFGSKTATKYANIQFDNLASAKDSLAQSELLAGSEFSLEVTNKALFVRKPTPGIDPTAPFEPQRQKVLEGLHAVRDLTAWLENNAAKLADLLQPRHVPPTPSPSSAHTHRDRENELREALLDIYRRCDRLGYRPTGMLDLMQDYGAVGAVKRLIANPISEGFKRLVLLGRLDLTVESLALEERWAGLFDEAELATCRRRVR
ncbi:hypothetical protein [Bradyrhizobium elkanii]|uniref:hypothetical protein n=1 Tax=Bradyrhizobium elkanii TaxID=29448 RepID=UPI003513A811